MGYMSSALNLAGGLTVGAAQVALTAYMLRTGATGTHSLFLLFDEILASKSPVGIFFNKPLAYVDETIFLRFAKRNFTKTSVESAAAIDMTELTKAVEQFQRDRNKVSNTTYSIEPVLEMGGVSRKWLSISIPSKVHVYDTHKRTKQEVAMTVAKCAAAFLLFSFGMQVLATYTPSYTVKVLNSFSTPADHAWKFGSWVLGKVS